MKLLINDVAMDLCGSDAIFLKETDSEIYYYSVVPGKDPETDDCATWLYVWNKEPEYLSVYNHFRERVTPKRETYSDLSEMLLGEKAKDTRGMTFHEKQEAQYTRLMSGGGSNPYRLGGCSSAFLNEFSLYGVSDVRQYCREMLLEHGRARNTDLNWLINKSAES